MDGVNSSESNAIELAQILNSAKCKVNIIPYNEIDAAYQRPDEEVISRFVEILYQNRDAYNVLVRWSKGQDINAGCGQLAGQKI